mmetsp:Transcript_108750/g.313336  ORF Transcript_108750/g.313336 Transcript_108750/m.313336 type:complete len:122 (-) Transcript_108750:117-482(-)
MSVIVVCRYKMWLIVWDCHQRHQQSLLWPKQYVMVSLMPLFITKKDMYKVMTWSTCMQQRSPQRPFIEELHTASLPTTMRSEACVTHLMPTNSNSRLAEEIDAREAKIKLTKKRHKNWKMN